MKTIGKPGYPWGPHELVWVEAALSLTVAGRVAAFRDIAAMTGRTLVAVEARAHLVKKATRKPLIVALASVAQQTPRHVMVPGVPPHSTMRRAA